MANFNLDVMSAKMHSIMRENDLIIGEGGIASGRYFQVIANSIAIDPKPHICIPIWTRHRSR